MNSNVILEVKGISKKFQATQALNDINFAISKCEVRALVGENGAGKSTFIKIIAGAHKPDSGQVLLDSKEVFFNNPKSAIDNGIAVIYQELDLVPQLGSLANIFLGFELKTKISKVLDKKRMRLIAEENLKKMGSVIDLSIPVKNLPIADQQVIAICKALVHEARIILMDEPSASLSSKELKNLFDLIRNLKMHDIAIIYVSHRLEEIFEIADSVSVLRDGRLISTDPISKVTKEIIIERMIGRKLKEDRINIRESNKNKEIILKIENLSYKNVLKNINFKVPKGEIFGILGLVGSGRLELAKILAGIYKSTSGDIFLNNKPVHLKSPFDAINKSISYVTDERKTQGLFFNLNVLLNSLMMSINKLMSKAGLINEKKLVEIFKKYQSRLNIKCSSYNQLVSGLSGGNQQKVLFAKCLSRNTDIIILNEPTKGIDVGSKFEIHQILVEYSQQGKTIVVFSPEIPELCNICDKILILKKGNVSKIFESQEINQRNILKELLK
ncbi:MAG: sugar ABC transporter ATP-binding protein [Actinobacteria bacterium]|nr:sugar ABC transporter ATP-binding protein [Actinomycetota bacterium]